MRPDPYIGFGGQVFRSVMIAKQNRLCHDAVGKRNILFGGDYANTITGQTSPGMTWSYDPAMDLAGDPQQGFRLVSPLCHGPGKLTPSYPDDSQACGMDYQQDLFIANPGGWRAADGTVCDIASDGKIASTPGSIRYHGMMGMRRNGDWIGISKNVEVLGSKNGHFDPVQRCLISVDSSNAAIARVYVDTPRINRVPLVPASIGTVANPPGRVLSASYLDGIDWGIDVMGRWGYVLSVSDVYSDRQTYDHSEHYFWRFNLDDPSKQQALADPPFGGAATHTQYNAGGTDRFRCQFDSRNRKVVHFYTRSVGAGVHGVGVYDPSNNAWSTIPIVQDVPVGLNRIAGNCHGYDATNNFHILMGAPALGTPGDDPQGQEVGWQPTHYSLFRL